MGPSTTPQLKKIWITRHGQSLFNADNKIGGDSMLTPDGVQYARQLSDELRILIRQHQGRNQAPVQVWTSTLKRTVQTASFLPEDFPQDHLPELDEIYAGACDGLTYPDVQLHHPEVHEGRHKDKLRFRYPGGENYEDLKIRVAPVLKRLQEQTGYVVIIAHQAVARVLYASLMNIPSEEMPHLEMPLHTLIELTPQASGSYAENRMKLAAPIVRRQIAFDEKCVSNAVGALPEQASAVQIVA